MENLRLSELFSQDELQGIMTAAQAEYNVKYSHDKEAKIFICFCFQSITHTQHICSTSLRSI